MLCQYFYRDWNLPVADCRTSKRARARVKKSLWAAQAAIFLDSILTQKLSSHTRVLHGWCTTRGLVVRDCVCVALCVQLLFCALAISK